MRAGCVPPLVVKTLGAAGMGGWDGYNICGLDIHFKPNHPLIPSSLRRGLRGGSHSPPAAGGIPLLSKEGTYDPLCSAPLLIQEGT